MHLEGLGRHVAFRIEIAVERLAGRKAVDQLDAADLDQPMPLIGIEAGGFGVEHDLAHCSVPQAESVPPFRHRSNRRAESRAPARARARSPATLSTTKSARRRFSASGICRARMRLELAPRSCRAAPARARAAPRPAPTPPPPHRPGFRRRSRTAAECRAPRPWRRCASRLGQELRARPARTSGCTIASSRLQRRRHRRAPRAPSFCAVDLAVRGRARKRRLDQRRRLAFVEPVHGRIGVVHRHALLGEQLRGGGLAHADRAGEAEDEHALTPPAVLRAAGSRAAAAAAGRGW